MIVINQDSTNVVTLTLNENVSLSTPTFLFRVTSSVTNVSQTFISADISPHPDRYNKFVIIEQAAGLDPLLGVINLTTSGLYSYEIYEQSSATNLDVELTGAMVERGELRYIPTPATVVTSSCDPVVTYHAFEKDEPTAYQGPATCGEPPEPSIIFDRPTNVWTGNTTSYALYDEGWHFANGTYDYGEAIGKMQRIDLSQGAASLYTLVYPNTFGNYDRFTDDLGTQVYAANLTIDHLTGLMWRRTSPGSANHSSACATANASTFGGFNDWRVASHAELNSILSVVVTRIWQNSPYFTGSGNTIIGSTVNITGFVTEYRVYGTMGGINQTQSRHCLHCRTWM